MRHYILPILIFLAAVGALFATGIWSLPAGPVPPLGPSLGKPPGISSPQEIADGPVQVLFMDESIVWDWNNTCEDELTAFLAEAGYPVAHLLVTLSDDDDLSLGVAYPDPETLDAVALGGCTVEGEPGPALDTTVAALLAYSIQDYFRDKSEEGWGKRPEWDWADYAPLVRESEAGWLGECVEVTK